jgi:hypothetical protein
LQLGIEQGHKKKGDPTDTKPKVRLALAGYRIITPCWSGQEQFEIVIDLESALDIHVLRQLVPEYNPPILFCVGSEKF